MKLLVVIFALLFSTSVFAGDCFCKDKTGSSKRECKSSPSECNAYCQQMNPGNLPDWIVTITYSPGNCHAKTIQNCEVAQIGDLGYVSGSKHLFCLNRGWNGGEASGNCWKTPGDPTIECPRLNLFYQTGDCKHLTDGDAATLKVCSHSP